MSDPKVGHKMQPVTSVIGAEQIGNLLRQHSRKRLAQELGERPDTVKNWQDGRCMPSAAKMIEMARKLPEIRAWLIQMIEPPTDEQLERDYQAMMRRIEALEKQFERNR